MTVLAPATRGRKPLCALAAPFAAPQHSPAVALAPSPEALALQAKLGGGALPLTSLSPADRTGLDNLSRRGVIRLLLSGGTAFVVRARR